MLKVRPTAVHLCRTSVAARPPYLQAVFITCNLRTRLAVGTGDPLDVGLVQIMLEIIELGVRNLILT
jgi:hypothetical protein